MLLLRAGQVFQGSEVRISKSGAAGKAGQASSEERRNEPLRRQSWERPPGDPSSPAHQEPSDRKKRLRRREDLPFLFPKFTDLSWRCVLKGLYSLRACRPRLLRLCTNLSMGVGSNAANIRLGE